MNTHIKRTIIIWMIITVVFYFMTAFVKMELNPAKWDAAVRFFLMGASLCAVMPSMILSDELK